VATISRFGPFFAHLRADPNQYVLHYRNGALVRQGTGLSYWFRPLDAAVSQVPVEDIETTFLLRERSADFQDVSVQCTVTYRVADPAQASRRINFALALTGGVWSEQPLERLAILWSARAQPAVRAALSRLTVTEAVGQGAQAVSATLQGALSTDPAIADAGLELVAVQVVRVAAPPDLEKALQAPVREAVQQRADEATFQRRALAVEKERAIKENELATSLELARRQENLVRQKATNRTLEVESEAAARARLAEADAEAEARRVAIWREAPTHVLLGLAAQQLAGKIESIQHLNISPDLLGTSLQQLLRDNAAGGGAITGPSSGSAGDTPSQGAP
jgi:regulator of protease activity HflC (stomatin/prohibitin superfamily)